MLVTRIPTPHNSGEPVATADGVAESVVENDEEATDAADADRTDAASSSCPA